MPARSPRGKPRQTGGVVALMMTHSTSPMLRILCGNEVGNR
jgi:hypothetical protein